MEFLLPNTVLDNLYNCDSCFKFLSVTPVKVFPNKKIKCGRCILEEDDAGALSRYNFIAERSVFKCVNRFDGCNALLTTSEVIEHEKSCQSKQYQCPICSKSIYTYLLIGHFTVYHKQYYLKAPSFNLSELNEIKQYFLYRHNKNLYFVTFDVRSNLNDNTLKTVCLSCLLIRDSHVNNNCKVTFNVIFGGICTEKQITCGTVSESSDEFTLSLKVNRQNVLVVVTFTLDFQASDNFIIQLPKVSSAKAVEDSFKRIFTEIEDKKRYVTSEDLLSLYFQERDIILHPDFKKDFPDVSITESSTISFSLSDSKICASLYCFFCSLVKNCVFTEDIDSLVFVAIKKKYYLICYPCSKAWHYASAKVFSVRNLKQVSYFCKWKCGESKKNNELQEHEKCCPKQIPQQCPIKLCKYYFKLYEIRDHFKLKHSEIIAQLFYDNHGQTDVNLDCSKSPLKLIFVVSHVYIHAEFVWEQPFWKITLSCEFPDAKLRAVILTADKTDGEYITVIKESGSFRHRDLVSVQCYLTHPDKEQYEKDVKKPID